MQEDNLHHLVSTARVPALSWDFTCIISLEPHNDPRRSGLFLSPIFQVRKQAQRSGDFQIQSDRGEIQTQVRQFSGEEESLSGDENYLHDCVTISRDQTWT